MTNYEEPNILTFKDSLKIKSTIICISNENQKQKLESTDTHGPIYHLQLDFNNVFLMQSLDILNKNSVYQIIVEWSTFKFFKNDYNIKTGEIMKTLFNLLKVGGQFYSECCWYSGYISTDVPMKYIPHLPNFTDEPSKDKLINLTSPADDLNERVFREYIPYYIENLIKDTPVNYIFEGLIKVESEETSTYPLYNNNEYLISSDFQ